MSLAPSLLLIRNIAVGVGAIATLGQVPSYSNVNAVPAQAPLSISGQVPTVNVTVGPSGAPDVGLATMQGLIPFLQRIKIISTGLPDNDVESNDLTPTLVWQETALPAKATLTISGKVPAIIGDNAQAIFPDIGYAVIGGLAPTISIPAGQEGTATPNRASMDSIGLAPTIVGTQFTASVAAPGTVSAFGESSMLTIRGLDPTLVVSRQGWQTVALAGDPTWVDVPEAI